MAETHGFLTKSRLIKTAVLAVAFVFIAYFATPLLFGSKSRVFQAKRGELVQTVVASGRVETPARVDIGAQVTGLVASVPVKEGQTVKAGDLLIELDGADEKAALELANANVRQAEIKLRQIQELTQPLAEQALQQAQVNVTNVQKQYDRTRELVAQGFVGQAQLDEAKRNLDIARSQVDSVKLQEKSSQPTGSDYQLALATLDQTRANQKSAQAKLQHTQIRAIADGTLISRDVERGDTVQPGKVLMVLSPVGLTQLLIQIDEKNLRYMQLGQSALAMADAYPGQKFPAELTFINPAVNAQRGSVDVKLNVPNPPPYLKQDMTVSVEIEVARRKDTLSLSAEAIHDVATSPWVMLINKGKAERRAISVGVRGDKSVEILSGLSEQDMVLPATGMAVQEGKRTRADLPRGGAAQARSAQSGG